MSRTLGSRLLLAWKWLFGPTVKDYKRVNEEWAATFRAERERLHTSAPGDGTSLFEQMGGTITGPKYDAAGGTIAAGQAIMVGEQGACGALPNAGPGWTLPQQIPPHTDEVVAKLRDPKLVAADIMRPREERPMDDD